MIVSIALNILIKLHLFVFDRTHTIYGVLQSRGFTMSRGYRSRMSFQAFAAILD